MDLDVRHRERAGHADERRRRRAAHRDPAGAGQHRRPDDHDPGQCRAPDTLQVKTLIKGTGPVVEQGEEIAVQYSGYIWRTGEVFQSSWTDGQGPFTT